MRRTAILLASAAAIISVPAQARDGQVYIGVNAGPSFSDEVEIESFGDDDTDLAVADTEVGLDADIVIGYDFGAFRLEAEGAYKRAGYDSLTILDSAVLPGTVAVPPGTVVENERDLKILSGMLNGLVEFGDDDGITFFVGGGAGIAEVELPVTVAGIGPVVDDDAVGFAWQGLAGARVAVSDNVDLGLKYRYFNVGDLGLTAVNGAPFEIDYSVHSVLASLTYNFGGRAAPPPPPPAPAAPPPQPPAPPAPPPPPAPAAAPCNTGPYIVFFDFDRSDITPEAATTLNQAITAYGNCGTSRVMLAGHTDRSGSVTYNMGLAERRNAAVRDYMTGRGVPGARISSEAFGEANPRVPTADGVRELQNRRVEVSYGPGSGM